MRNISDLMSEGLSRNSFFQFLSLYTNAEFVEEFFPNTLDKIIDPHIHDQ